MWLLNLPEDILIIILKKLDTVSLYNLYITCHQIRDIICVYKIIKICDFSLSTLSTEQSLNLNFFRDISKNLLELNVSGISLCKTTLLPVMKKLKNLKTLNISYTNIDILDFLELYNACPNIENISINLIFNSTKIRSGLPKKSLMGLQKIFKNFKIVNFVGTLSTLVYSKLPFFLLSKSKLEKIEYTVVECNKASFHIHYNHGEDKLGFDEFRLCIRDENNIFKNYGCMYELFLFQTINFDELEIIIFVQSIDLKKDVVYITPIFEFFFNNHFKCKIEYITDFSLSLSGNVLVLFWNKKTTTFDNKFFAKLLQTLRPYFPYRFSSENKTPVPTNYNWYYTFLSRPSTLNTSEPLFKKPRTADLPFSLDFNEQFKENHEVQLVICFDIDIRSVALSHDYEYLKKLTFLSLFGPVRYSVDFFNILFTCCDKLTTLNIDSPPISSCITLISKAVQLSKSLKNLRIVDNKINLTLLYASLSQCKSIEIVIISDLSTTIELSDPTVFFNNCDNLYCLYVYAHGSESILSKKLQILKNARKKCKKLHIRVKVFENSCIRYDPFVGVFKLNPIQP